MEMKVMTYLEVMPQGRIEIKLKDLNENKKEREKVHINKFTVALSLSMVVSSIHHRNEMA